jgi:hypothetical protein
MPIPNDPGGKLIAGVFANSRRLRKGLLGGITTEGASDLQLTQP